MGTIGRNTYIGDGLYATDVHLSRYFQIREKVKLKVSVDAFNLFNRPNVDEINPVYGVPGFCGPVPMRYKDGASKAVQAGQACPFGIFPAPLPPIPQVNPLFGTARTVFNPRQLQFAAKFSF